jgi:uncharacterized protein (DUF2062 family)
MYVGKKLIRNFRGKVSRIAHYSFELDPGKAALSIAVSMCLGVVPLLGFTFILVTLTGFVFRLNQPIIQTIHLLLTPLQLILLYPLVKAGQVVFNLPYAIPPSFDMSLIYVINHLNVFLVPYSKLLLAACAVWSVFSLIFGTIAYAVFRLYFNRLQTRTSFAFPGQ